MSTLATRGVALGLALASIAAAQEQTVLFRDGQFPTPAYAGTRDVRLSESNNTVFDPNANFDTVTDQVDGWNAQKVALLRWDLSALPATATINSATITLNVLDAGDDPYPIYECLRPWVASEATFMQVSLGTSWATPGAQGIGTDRGSTVLGTINPTRTGAVTFTLNANGIAALQAWVRGTRPNAGFVISSFTTSDGVEWSSAEDNQANRRPRLSVTYNGTSRMDFQNGNAPTSGYAGNRDTTIANGPPPELANWNGWGHNLDGSSGHHESVLLSFDLGAIAPGSTVTAASLLLYVTNASADSYPIYEALRPWSETAACWLNYDTDPPWAVAGADSTLDHGSTVLGTVTAVGLGTASIPLNATGVRLVQDWVDRQRANRGFEIINYANSDDLGFHDRENATASFRSALSVTFLNPEPMDGGTGSTDGGMGSTDGGSGSTDGGSGATDGGSGGADAGSDAGMDGGNDGGTDGGSGLKLESVYAGCSCGSTRAGSLAFGPALAVLAALRRVSRASRRQG